MTASRLNGASVVLVVGLLAGCATPPAPDPTAEATYCHKTNKGRVIACTTAPAPSLNADALAKQFAPEPTALTFTWATEAEDTIRERAMKARLIADLTVR